MIIDDLGGYYNPVASNSQLKTMASSRVFAKDGKNQELPHLSTNHHPYLSFCLF